jgi:hypothetical protein
MSLQEIMDWQKEKGIGLEVPQIMVHLCEGVLRLNGHSALGIFRSVTMPQDPSATLALADSMITTTTTTG